jgi:hypothetical protein
MGENYIIEDITIQELDDKVDEIWNKVQNDPDFRKWAKDNEIEVDQLKNVERKKVITIEKETQEAGLGDVATAIIVAFAPVAAKVAKDLWEKVIFPWLLKEMGHNKIKAKD